MYIIFLFYILNFFPNIFGQNFICNNGETVEANKICNGISDCPDSADETSNLCRRFICPLGKFQCHYGACIDAALKCDGIQNCNDGSDEILCGNKAMDCKSNEFKCSTGECIPITRLCDGITDCKANSDEGSICKKQTACPPLTHRCNIGNCIYMNQRCDGYIDCLDGSDESDTLCESLKCNTSECYHKDAYKHTFCPPIQSERILSHCEIPSGPNMGIIPCSNSLPPGTVVRYKCKPYYIPATPEDQENKEMLCQLDGTWNRDPLQCVPDCGVATRDVAVLIVNGWKSEKGKFPWHATLYTLEEGKWIFTCGGTLITEKVVLTAAHCTWGTPPEMLQIALGKIYSNYYKEEEHVQFISIKEIITQPAYQDFEGNYGSDIAILILNTSVHFSPVVRPACVDWNLNDINEHLETNNIGLIAGMGITENNTFSEKLRALHLPAVSDEECLKNQKQDFRKYITFTSFCAGWGNGTGVCNGDSGGGLVFPSIKNPNKYTIQGIVSVSPRRPGTSFCDPNYYTVFTKVGMYVQWIRSILATVHDNADYENNFVF